MRADFVSHHTHLTFLGLEKGGVGKLIWWKETESMYEGVSGSQVSNQYLHGMASIAGERAVAGERADEHHPKAIYLSLV